MVSFSSILTFKSLSIMGLSVILGFIFIETDDDTFICEQSVALPYNRATVFKYISDMRTYARVRNFAFLLYV